MLIFLLLALVPVENTGDKAKEIKIHAKAPSGVGGVYRQMLVIRSVEELSKVIPANGKDGKQLTQMAAAQLKVKTIDWDKQMMIVTYAGEKPTGGYSVDLKSLEVKDKMLIVNWKLNSPGPDDLVTQAITHPELVILVDRFDGQVVFDPPALKK